MLGIKPAGDFDATVVTREGNRRGVAWCKRCGRKHPRKAPCDLVEYEPGKFMSRQSYEQRGRR
jgi:hypothetical protein